MTDLRFDVVVSNEGRECAPRAGTARLAGPCKLVLALLVGASVTTSRAALASPFLETFGVTTATNPFTARVLPTSAGATWANPALLLDTAPRVDAGIVLVRQAFRVDLQARPEGADVPESIYDARALNPDGTTRRLGIRPLPTASLRSPRGSAGPSSTATYVTFGTSVQPIPGRLAFGLHVVLPTRSFQSQRSWYVDEREQYFSNSLHHELYGDRLETNLISLAGAVRPLSWLAVGAGATASNESRATNQIFIPDAADQSVTVLNTDVEVKTRLRPYVGLDAAAWEPLHVTATVHFPYANDTTGSSDLQLWNYEYPRGQSSFLQGFGYQSHATPLTAAAGVSWRHRERGQTGFAAAAAVIWTNWSSYLDRHHEKPLDPWLDTFSAAAGANVRWHAHRLGVDATYAPSPVPPQNGRTNYVDNDRAGGALGYAGRFTIAGLALEAGAQVQLHRLLPRSETKSSAARHPVLDEFPDSVDARTGAPIAESAGLQTNNPGYPGYRSDGWLWTAGLSLSMLLDSPAPEMRR